MLEHVSPNILKKKRPSKSNKDLLPTPFKGVFSGKLVIYMVEYDSKIQEQIYQVRAHNASSPVAY